MGSIVKNKSNLSPPSTPPPVATGLDPSGNDPSSNAPSHILVIEDEDLLRDAICNSLLEDGFGYTVSQAASAEEALPLLEANKIDLIVLDLMLPGRDGFDFIRDLRAWPKTKHIPIIVVTARDTIPHRVQGLDLGADDYVTKPFALSELKARIRAHLRHTKEPAQRPEPAPITGRRRSILKFSKLRLEKARRATFLKDENGAWNPVTLTQREFDMLWFLAENKDIPKMRADILSAILPEKNEVEKEEEEIVLPNTMDVHIHNLRRKIGPLWIKTVYRAGVRFVDPFE